MFLILTLRRSLQYLIVNIFLYIVSSNGPSYSVCIELHCDCTVTRFYYKIPIIRTEDTHALLGATRVLHIRAIIS